MISRPGQLLPEQFAKIPPRRTKMPALLLPSTATPYATRSPPKVVLNTKVDPWLTATLKRINRVKRPLNSAPQHTKCLTETLSTPQAIWTLCSLLVEKAPEAEIERHENPLIDALFRYQLLHIQAYVVHIDLVLSNEIAFKLTSDTIKDLVNFHKNVYMVDQRARMWDWAEKEAQVTKMHDAFCKTVNSYVFRTDAIALEGMEDDGAGELLCGRSLDVKNAVLGFFLPLMPPPPPRIVDIPRPVPLLPSSPNAWWGPTVPSHGSPNPPPVEAWKVVPSSPATDMPPSSMPPHSSPSWDNQNLPPTTLSHSPHQQSYSLPPTTSSYYPSPPVSVPQLPLPSLVAMQCSTGAGSFGGFGWDRGYSEYGSTM